MINGCGSCANSAKDAYRERGRESFTFALRSAAGEKELLRRCQVLLHGTTDAGFGGYQRLSASITSEGTPIAFLTLSAAAIGRGARSRRSDHGRAGPIDKLFIGIMSAASDMLLLHGFRFLDLPPEVRNQIYALLLTAQYCPGQLDTYGFRGRVGLTTAILRVSQQLYTECAALLYSLNVFHAHPALLASMPFLTEISRPVVSPLNTALIRRYYMEVRLDNDPTWTGDDLRRAFSGIRELHVVSWQASYGTCGMTNLFPFVHVRGVEKATVQGSNVPVEFARWLEGVMQSKEEEDVFAKGLPALPEWDCWENGNR